MYYVLMYQLGMKLKITIYIFFDHFTLIINLNFRRCHYH